MKRKIMTVIRTVLLALSIINEIISTVGVVDFHNYAINTTYIVISQIAIIGASAWAWWKNNSFTKEAQAADEYLDDLKSGGEDI